MHNALTTIRSTAPARLHLLLAAGCGALLYLSSHALERDRYKSTAELELVSLQHTNENIHLSHQHNAHSLEPRQLIDRSLQPENILRLPWWHDLRDEALASTKAEGTSLTELEQAKRVVTNISFEIAPDNTNFTITFTSHDPALSSLIANGIARSLVYDARMFLAEKRREYVRFIEEQLQRADQELLHSLSEMAKLEPQALAWNEQKNSDKRLAAIERALNLVTEERVALEAKANSAVVSIQDSASGEHITSLQQKAAEIELAITTASKELAPKHPRMKALIAEKSKIQQLLSKEFDANTQQAHALVSALRSQEDVLRTEMLKQRQLREALEQQAKRYESMKTEIAALEDAKQWWSTQLAYARTQLGSFADPLRIKVPARINPQALAPLSISTLLACSVLTTLLYWAFYVRKVLRTRRYLSLDHAQEYLGIENIAILPQVEGLFLSQPIEAQRPTIECMTETEPVRTIGNSHEVAARSDTSQIGNIVHLLPQMIVPGDQPELQVPPELMNAFRHLHTRVLLQLPDSAKTLVVLSAIPFEGKSTVATQLAVSLARAGNRTLLLDATVTTVRTRHRFPGFAELLSKELNSIDDAVIASNTPALWTLGAGNPTHETRNLLYSKRCAQLLEHLAARFDYVIIDCPAISTAAEAIYLADLVDAYLLVSDFEIGDRTATRSALKQLRKTKAQHAGLVFNRYNTKRCGTPEQLSVLAG